MARVAVLGDSLDYNEISSASLSGKITSVVFHVFFTDIKVTFPLLDGQIAHL